VGGLGHNWAIQRGKPFRRGRLYLNIGVSARRKDLRMVDPVAVCAVVAGARLAYSLVSLCMSPVRERARARALAALLRAAGPGGMAAATGADGNVMIVRAAPPRSRREAGR
jgi:hypothetical protein